MIAFSFPSAACVLKKNIGYREKKRIFVTHLKVKVQVSLCFLVIH